MIYKISQKIMLTLLFLSFSFGYFSNFFFKHYSKDDITLVTALFKIKSKFSFDKYLLWVENLLLLNHSIVFFVDKNISNIIKNKRPKLYENKTVWIELSIDQFYSYKKFGKNFAESYIIDKEKAYHTIPLYLVWAEKCFFVKKAIKYNYFQSKCFYWIDAGYFRDKEDKYVNNWPSSKKCKEDPRVIINGIRNISEQEILQLKNFNISFYNNFINKNNVGGGLFGGKSYFILKFINLYYKTIVKFIKNNMFIGKDQNLFAYISYLNPKIVKIINSGLWRYFKVYLSE